MDYTVPYNGPFRTTKDISRKKAPSAEAQEIREYCRTHPLSVRVSPNGEIIFEIQTVPQR